MSIRDLSIRCSQKGKTRGRPSRREYMASLLCSYFYKEYCEERLRKLLYGEGIKPIEWDVTPNIQSLP